MGRSALILIKKKTFGETLGQFKEASEEFYLICESKKVCWSDGYHNKLTLGAYIELKMKLKSWY
jgi:hypothetical protein